MELRARPRPGLLRTGTLALVVLAAALGAWPSVASAAADPPAPWTTIRLPGTVAGLKRAADLSTEVSRSALVAALVRRIHLDPEGRSRDTDARRTRVLAYLRTFAQLDAVVQAADPQRAGILLDSTRTPSKPIGAVLEFFGLRVEGGKVAASPSAGPDETARLAILAEAGVDLTSVARDLGAGTRVVIRPPGIDVPLPLSPGTWTNAIFDRAIAAEDLAGAILMDRRASLVYYGLLSVDPPTAQFLAAHPGLFRRIYEEHAGVFAAFGRSLHVKAGGVAIEGGAGAVALWEELIGEKVSAPEAFMLRVLGAGEGRLAYLFDTVAHLDAARARFALGLASDAGARLDRLRRLYSAFETLEATWKPNVLPFTRPTSDGFLMLRLVAVTDQGVLTPPGHARLWEAAFGSDTIFDGGNTPSASVLGGAPADAASLAAWVLAGHAPVRQQRLQALLFAQRVFADSTPAALPDVLVAVRAFRRYPALMLVVERIGITDPGVCAAIARQAARIERLGSDARGTMAIAQFQSALSLLDRIAWAGTLDRDQLRELVASLAAVPFDTGRRRPPALALWMAEHLLARLPGEPGAAREDRLLAAMAGMRVASAPRGVGPVLRWEDHDYRLDLAAAELARLRGIRAKQKGNRLDAVIDFAGSAARLATPGLPATEVRPLVARIVRASAELEPVRFERFGERNTRPPGDVAARVNQRAERKDPSQLDPAALAEEAVETAEDLLTDVLLALAYAVHLGDPDGTVLLGGNVSSRHDFMVGVSGARYERRAWTLPEEQTGRGVLWHVSGSVLALDTALAPLALRNLEEGAPDGVPTLNGNDRLAFARTAALVRADRLLDEDRDEIAAAIRRGRNRVAAAVGDPSALPAIVQDGGVSEWRGQVLSWAAVSEPEAVPRAFSLTELFWIGRPRIPPGRLEAWGVSRLAIDGCLDAGFPNAEPWEHFAHRPAWGQLSGRLADLALRVDELVAALRLPAAIVPSVLLAATRDFVDAARPDDIDDLVALALQASAVTRERVEDYVSSLTARGPLLPLQDGRKQEAP